MSGYSVTARTKASYRRKSAIYIGIVAVLSCAAIVLAVYNLLEANWFFVISYLIAALLGITYVSIRMNTVYPTYIAVDKQSVYMRRWVNGFMPYNTKFRPAVLREFIPAKTELVECPLKEIKTVYIGTKNYIKRTAETGAEFGDDVEPFEKSRDFTVRKAIQSMDIFYVETVDGSYTHMPISEFGVNSVIKVLRYINKANPEASFGIYSRAYKRFTPVSQANSDNNGI